MKGYDKKHTLKINIKEITQHLTPTPIHLIIINATTRLGANPTT